MHIHLPDGVLPVWLWAAGLAIAAITVAFSAFMLRKGLNKKAAMIGVFAALMLVAMNIPLGPIPYHINLTAVAGIFLGPFGGMISVAITNALLALMGHGGITVSGLNMIVLGFEACAGWLLFKALRPVLSNPGLRGAVSVFFAMVASTVLFLGMVAFSGLDPSAFSHNHDHEHEEAEGAHGHDEHGHEHEEDAHEGEHEHESISLSAFAAATVPVALLGAAIEALIAGAMIGYIARARPGMVENA